MFNKTNMFKYFIVLLLVNTQYKSFGSPVPQNTVDLGAALTTLAGGCKNPFLKQQILSKVEDCSVQDITKKKQFECLMFLDINKQLCSSDSVLTLNKDYTEDINTSYDVNDLCTDATGWKFLNLSEVSNYQVTAQNVFSSQLACIKVCGSDDWVSHDSNLFCKYFKWGSNKLHKLQAPPNDLSVQVNAPNSAVEVSSNVAKHENDNNNDIQVSVPQVQDTASGKDAETPVKVPDSTNKAQVAPNNDAVIEEIKVSSSTQQQSQNNPNVDEPSVVATNNQKIDKPVSENAILPEDPEEMPPKKEDIEKAEFNPVYRQPVIETPKQKEIAEDDPDQGLDSEEGNDGLPDNQGGDDGDDPLIGDMDAKLPEPNTKPEKKIEGAVATFNGENISQREFFSNSDGFTDENDSDFFPFFLTTIIVVVLLYILYHNKGRVTKLFFGLLVEGRNNRRRNSRGHSYRRLDTLEQAMNTNSATPPSKIIY